MDITKMSPQDIRGLYSKVTFNKISELAYYLDGIEFPQNKKIPYQGPTVSKVSNPVFWLEWDNDNEEPKLRSNLVPGKPENVYYDDLTNYKFLVALRDCVMKAAESHKKYFDAKTWIMNGGKCVYRYGWAYRGAGCSEITKEKAITLFPKYGFGSGFYTLSWVKVNGEKALEFNELSENDMW